MNYYTTPDVLVYMYIVGSNFEPVRLDTVSGIMYQAQGDKIPIFSHKSIEFDAIAEGNSIVTGLLIVNKGYKDMIAAVISDISNSKILPGLPKNSEVLEESANIDGAISFIKEQLVELQLISNGVRNSAKFGLLGNYDLSTSQLDLVVNSLNDYINENTQIVNKLGLESLINDLINVIFTSLTPKLSEIETLYMQLVASFGINPMIILQYSSMVSEYTSLSNIALKEASSRLRDISSLNNESRIDQQLSSLDQESTTSQNNKIYGSDMFNLLRKKGYSIQLHIEFGKPDDPNSDGDHMVIIDDCYFSSESSNVSTDNRDNIKESYSFIAKSIK